MDFYHPVSQLYAWGRFFIQPITFQKVLTIYIYIYVNVNLKLQSILSSNRNIISVFFHIVLYTQDEIDY